MIKNLKNKLNTDFYYLINILIPLLYIKLIKDHFHQYYTIISKIRKFSYLDRAQWLVKEVLLADCHFIINLESLFIKHRLLVVSPNINLKGFQKFLF